MTNFEKYKERIKEIVSRGNDLAVRNGELGICRLNDGKCDYCDFDKKGETCSLTTLKWLLKDDGTPSAERAEGQNEALELAYKIYMMSPDKQKECFGKSGFKSIAENNTYTQAAEKVKAWENSKMPKVGDEYYSKESGMKFVVTAVYDYTLYVIYADGSAGEERPSYIAKNYTKTGRTLPVSDWLKQIGGEE